jgi:hypothetical protein
MSVLPGATALSGASAVLTVDLPVEMVQDPTGTYAGLLDDGPR